MTRTRLRILSVGLFAALVLGAAYAATGLPLLVRTISYVYASISGRTRVGQGFVGVMEFGHWRLICVPRSDSSVPATNLDAKAIDPKQKPLANACRVNQEVAADDKPARVIVAANLTIVGPQKKPALMLRLPPTLRTGDAVALRPDNGQAVKTAVRDCTANECVAASAISDEDWSHLVSAGSLQVTFPVTNGQMVFVNLGVDGLTEAAAAMDAAQIVSAP